MGSARPSCPPARPMEDGEELDYGWNCVQSALRGLLPRGGEASQSTRQPAQILDPSLASSRLGSREWAATFCSPRARKLRAGAAWPATSNSTTTSISTTTSAAASTTT